MSEELGRVERPLVSEYEGARKLYFVPLVLLPEEPLPDHLEMVNRYWEQVEAQVANLERKLGQVKRVYHELVAVGGEEGAKALEQLNAGSYLVAKSRLDRGAELQPIEDGELLGEYMDWGRCLALGLQSERAFTQVYQAYSEAHRKRNEHMAKQIDETLRSAEAGVLLMREGHQVQFPSSIQVFYVAPPGLDELKRWLRAREAETL
ncbi:MAG: hypothetical protein HW388_119 [Dehalococcoidia bacterium]|nr:hypothetical protein [Dehalococcoidia bacterium]